MLHESLQARGGIQAVRIQGKSNVQHRSDGDLSSQATRGGAKVNAVFAQQSFQISELLGAENDDTTHEKIKLKNLMINNK